jgi:hypothetical protein
VQSCRRHHHDPTVAEVGCSSAEKRFLEPLSDRAEHVPTALRLPTVRHPPQHKPGQFHLAGGFSCLAHRVKTYSPITSHNGVQHAVDLDQLDEAGVLQHGEQSVKVHPPAMARSKRLGACGMGAHRTGTHRRLQTLPLPREPRNGQIAGPGGLQTPHDIAKCRKLSDELLVVGGAHCRYGERRRPPALAPGQQPASIAPAQRFALGNHRELSTMCRGMRTQLGRTKAQPMLVEGVEAPATCGQRRPHILACPTEECLGEPGGAAAQRRATPPGPGRPSEVFLGDEPLTTRQSNPAGQQMRRWGLFGP